MGSFDFTCALSGLPITCGDEVKWYLLTESPYTDSAGVCYPHDLWYRRSQPVSARYNDYGSIESYDEKSPSVMSILEAFKKDLIEVGVGDNRCHDTATSKDMSFEALLVALSEERVLVIRDMDRGEVSGSEKLPTLRKIISLLEQGGFEINKGFGDGGYLVDERGQGWVRVRSGGFGEAKSLSLLIPLLKQFATVITAGSGSYSNREELQVMPLPVKEGHLSFLDEITKKPCKVYQAMILKEVWDSISDVSYYTDIRDKAKKEWDGEVRSSIELKERIELIRKLKNEEVPDVDTEELIKLLSKVNMFRNPDSISYSSLPFTMGVGEHFAIATECHDKEHFSEDQINEFLDDVAGFSCINAMVHSIRYWWRPSFSCGPQFGEYKSHEEWHKRLTSISKKLGVKHSYDEEVD